MGIFIICTTIVACKLVPVLKEVMLDWNKKRYDVAMEAINKMKKDD